MFKLSRRVKRHFRLVLAGPILAMLIITALGSTLVSPYDPYKINARNTLKSPSRDHLLGTDQLGRDILSRIIYGSRISLSVSAAAILIALLIGATIGLISSYLGGRFDNIAMRIIDIFVCLPEIFVAIVIVAFLEHGLRTLIITIGLLYFPQFAKVTHGVSASLKHRDFILAARSLGASTPRILTKEILPNMFSVIIVQVSFTMSFAMLLEAGLSFLGLGVMPPQPSWGQMIGELKDFIFINPWPVVFPSAALFLAVFSINTLGDWLQDMLNPEIIK